MSRNLVTPIACVLALSGSMLGGAALGDLRWSPRSARPPARPCRIVSLSLPADEVLLEIVEERDRLLALEAFIDDPQVSNAVEAARTVRRRLPMEAEAVLAVRPDLVILPPWADTTLRALLDHEGVPVLVVPTPRSVAEVRASIRAIGAAVGEPERAEALIAAMDARLGAVRAQRAGRSQATIVRWSWSGWTPARGSLFCEIVEIAGGLCATAIAGLEGEAPLGIEHLLALDPDAIVVDAYRADGRARELLPSPSPERDPRFQSLRAIRHRRVLAIPGPHLLTTSHHVAALAESLAHALDRAEGLR